LTVFSDQQAFMKIYTEFFEKENALFKRADAILKKNGIYDVTKRSAGYIIEYIFSEGWRFAYTVLKGKDGKAFKFTIGKKRAPQSEIELVKGDVLYFRYATTKKTFFYCPKVLIGKREFKMESSIGFTSYGTKADMLKDGLIKSCLSCDISTYFEKLKI
jgi:hypothetical protein